MPLATQSPSRPNSSMETALGSTTASTVHPCLLCNHESPNMDSNLVHMQIMHAFSIPHQDCLLVDLNILVQYLHLVVHEYNECLYCHTQRGDVEAVQQHMMSTGHFRFDISEGNSEFRDFYDFRPGNNTDSRGDTESVSETETDSDDSERQTQVWQPRPRSSPCRVEQTSLRLPSGRVVGHRSTPASRPTRRRNRAPSPETARPPDSSISDEPSSEPTVDDRPTSKAITKQQKRDTVFAAQLASMRASDRKSIAHLPASEQRTLIAMQQRHIEKGKRAENRFAGHMDGLGNVLSKEQFVNDVPGGKSHKNRFMAA
ncbi:Uu.00g145180.m01.CDS01 [Anthostomella pinea]|uniref:Uu.00g145180.m01.CDS01 n=1 Tax=Anthostomella pinea TaxID=933095 RepID=A0AAI8VS58_9PEZI|nr:Uu.00g145180.m01.CDS01 [Anthostomella pinea]